MKRTALALTFILILLVSTMVGVHFGTAQSGTSVGGVNGPYTMSFGGVTSASPDTQDQKPAVLNGQNYIVILNATSWQYPSGVGGVNGVIQVWSANSAWQPVSLLAQTGQGYCDFCVFTYPSLSTNTLYICGEVNNSSQCGFIGIFNTNTNAFNDMQLVPNCHIVNQLYYIQSLNEFVITAFVGGSYAGDIITASPSNLFNQANWNFYYNMTSNIDPNINLAVSGHMFAYDQTLGLGFILGWDFGYGTDLFSLNMSGMPTLTSVYQSGSYEANFIGSGGVRCFVSSDGTNVYFSCSMDSAGIFNYYIYNGTSVSCFASLAMIEPNSDGQHQANIIPLLNGQVLILDECDSSIAAYGVGGYWALYSGNTQLQTFPGIQVHYSDNVLVLDSNNNIVLGGECVENNPTAQAVLTVLTPNNPTPTPTPTSSGSTVSATTNNGSTVDLSISGNLTSSQMSNVTIATNQSDNTTVDFTVTGENGTTGFGNITIPISLVSYGSTPTIYIDGQPAPNQGFTQDSNNYYVWYTTHFSTHQISIVFTKTSSLHSPIAQSSLLKEIILGVAAGAVIVAIVVAALVLIIKGRKAKVERNTS